MKRNRKFSNSFKLKLVDEVLSGRASGAQLSRRYNLSGSSMSNWISAYRAGKLKPESVEVHDDEHPDALRTRIEELEKMVGKLALENDMLKKTNLLYQRLRQESSSTLTNQDLDLYQRHAEHCDFPEAPTTTRPRKPTKKTYKKRRTSGTRSKK